MFGFKAIATDVPEISPEFTFTLDMTTEFDKLGKFCILVCWHFLGNALFKVYCSQYRVIKVICSKRLNIDVIM